MASLENRGGGTWQVIICNGYNPDGSKKRLKRTVYVDPQKTELSQRREVEKIAAALETDFSRKLITAAKKITIADLAKEYIQDHIVRRGLAPRTVECYTDLIDGKIVPALGKLYVQDLTPRHINEFYRKLEKKDKNGKKLSGTYRLKFHQQLHEMLKYAVRTGYISVNPADMVEAPRRDTKEAAFYELEDCSRLLAALDNFDDIQWRLFFTMSIFTGMRPGELIGLNWSDINNNILTVKAGFVQLHGQKSKRTDRPKTKKSVRMIDLPAEVIWLLKKHKKEQEKYRKKFGKKWPEPDAVFTDDLGERLSKYSPSKHWNRFVKKNNLRPIPLYGLRHTAATLMIAEKISARDVAARLGHAQTSTTLNIYAHSFMDANSRATKAITNALSKARKVAN